MSRNYCCLPSVPPPGFVLGFPFLSDSPLSFPKFITFPSPVIPDSAGKGSLTTIPPKFFIDPSSTFFPARWCRCRNCPGWNFRPSFVAREKGPILNRFIPNPVVPARFSFQRLSSTSFLRCSEVLLFLDCFIPRNVFVSFSPFAEARHGLFTAPEVRFSRPTPVFFHVPSLRDAPYCLLMSKLSFEYPVFFNHDGTNLPFTRPFPYGSPPEQPCAMTASSFTSR